MARAKRTDRAAARRRYRAYAATATAEGEADAVPVPEAARRQRPSDSGRAAAAGTERPGTMAAFRMAYRPPRFREDLRLLPRLIVSKAFLIPAALVLVAGVLMLTPLMSDRLVGIFVGAMVFVPPAYSPPLIAPFLSGFLAERASYLIGGMVGLVVVVMFAVYVFVTPAEGVGAAERAWAVAQALTIEVPTAMLFASFAAYYKRLLRVWQPARGERDRKKG